MAVPLKIEQRIRDFLKAHGMAAINFSVMTKEFNHGLSETMISQAVRGVREFDRPDTIFLADLLNKIERFVQAAKPIPVNLRTDPIALCKLIRDLDRTPADSPTLADLILITEILQGHGLQQAADSRHLPLPELRQTLSEAAVKVQKASWRVTEILNG
jgi:hypothetical protein